MRAFEILTIFFLMIMAGIAITMILSSPLSKPDPNTPKYFKELVYDPTSRFSIVKDLQTGCEYVSLPVHSLGGITPRLTSEGKPKCD